MKVIYLLLNILYGQTTYPTDSIGKVFIDYFRIQTDCFKDL